MKDIKSVVAKNLGTLRKQKGLTQAELAERLNYSDKAISRWEKGDTLPDINVLYDLCHFYGITMNDLVSEEECKINEDELIEKNARQYRIWMCALSGVSVWLLATLWFVYTFTSATKNWIVFVWSVPISCFLMLFVGRSMFNWITKFVLMSVISWTTIASLYLHMFVFNHDNFWQLFILGVPVQAIIFLWQRMWRYRSYKKKVKDQAKYDTIGD